MNMHSEKTARGLAEAGEAEATLRVIAGLPAPAGLEDRVKARLERQPAGSLARVLEWPARSWVRSALARGAAAAAIVAVVAGGSWGVYSRVQPRQAPIAIPHVGGAGGFSSANAVRTPKTLDVPTVMLAANHKSAAGEKQADGKKKGPRSGKTVGLQATAQSSGK
jgi:hypothetical protein